jgi:hypothetical protein
MKSAHLETAAQRSSRRCLCATSVHPRSVNAYACELLSTWDLQSSAGEQPQPLHATTLCTADARQKAVLHVSPQYAGDLVPPSRC